MPSPKPNSPGPRGNVAPNALAPESCRNCANARLHTITFPDVPEFEQEVRLCAAGSQVWTTVVSSESFFQQPKKWQQRAARCTMYRRKLGAR